MNLCKDKFQGTIGSRREREKSIQVLSVNGYSTDVIWSVVDIYTPPTTDALVVFSSFSLDRVHGSQPISCQWGFGWGSSMGFSVVSDGEREGG